MKKVKKVYLTEQEEQYDNDYKEMTYPPGDNTSNTPGKSTDQAYQDGWRDSLKETVKILDDSIRFYSSGSLMYRALTLLRERIKLEVEFEYYLKTRMRVADNTYRIVDIEEANK